MVAGFLRLRAVNTSIFKRRSDHASAEVIMRSQGAPVYMDYMDPSFRLFYRQIAYLSETLLIFQNINKAGFQNNSGTFDS